MEISIHIKFKDRVFCQLYADRSIQLRHYKKIKAFARLKQGTLSQTRIQIRLLNRH